MASTATQSASPPAETGVIPVISEYIGVRPGYCGGEPHILGHRIKVRHVAVWHEEMGMSPAQIAVTYPTITLDALPTASYEPSPFWRAATLKPIDVVPELAEAEHS